MCRAQNPQSGVKTPQRSGARHSAQVRIQQPHPQALQPPWPRKPSQTHQAGSCASSRTSPTRPGRGSTRPSTTCRPCRRTSPSRSPCRQPDSSQYQLSRLSGRPAVSGPCGHAVDARRVLSALADLVCVHVLVGRGGLLDYAEGAVFLGDGVDGCEHLVGLSGGGEFHFDALFFDFGQLLGNKKCHLEIMTASNGRLTVGESDVPRCYTLFRTCGCGVCVCGVFSG